MVSDLAILRSAKLVLDHHGEDALVYAAKRADELLERGNPEGYEVWIAILGVPRVRETFVLAQEFGAKLPTLLAV